VRHVRQSEDALRWVIGDLDVVRQTFEAVPVPLVRVDGPDFVVVAVNAACRALTGKSDLVGKPARQVLPELAGQQSFEVLEQVYRTGEPYWGRDWRVQVLQQDTGHRVEMYVDFALVPWRDGSGAVTGLLGTVMDVTDQVRERRDARTQAVEAQQRFEQAREVIGALQRELLPHGLPALPRARVAGAYLTAEAGTAAGGDWFDATTLDDGRLALSVGDVVGHGVTASATMGQLRALVDEGLHREQGDIVRVLQGLDRAAGRIPPARAATVCIAILDLDTGELEYCTAGHPPPLLLGAGREPRYLPPTAGGPLCTSGTYEVRTDYLGPDDVLLLYTDGIIERPGRPPAQSMVELARVSTDVLAGRAMPDPRAPLLEQVCTQTVEMLVRVTGHADDITLLAVQRRSPVPEFRMDVPARLTALADIRRAFGSWLETIGVGSSDVLALQLVVGELATNGAEHAYPDEVEGDAEAPRPLTINARLSPLGEIDVTVADRGLWRAPAKRAGRGRGLTLSPRLVDSLVVDHGAGGTTVTVQHRITTRARLLTTDSDSHRPTPDAPSLLLVLDQPRSDEATARRPGRRIRLDGPLDATTAPNLSVELTEFLTKRLGPLTVDMTGVTHVASAGVAALHEAVATCLRTGTGLEFYAPPGSTAQQVLSLVEIPHVALDPDLPAPPAHPID
jgi:serine phosphatase RsbU (regulator of sigma subunit)/anti-sigma regulatory factor (Ser/Thr protein kinase)/ABC-type transporter Mla MlaB component